jgi:flagellar protein FlgJ
MAVSALNTFNSSSIDRTSDPSTIARKLENISAGGKKISRDQKMKQLKEAAAEFESIFVHNLLKSMRSTIQKTNIISGGNAETIYQDMLDENYSKIAVKRSDFGIARKVYEQFSKTIK